MLEERAKVIAVDKSSVWVEAKRESACGRCAVNKGCGNAVLQKVLGKKRNIFQLSSDNFMNEVGANDISIQVGDEVIIGVDENILVKSSLLVYAAPIVAIIVFAMLGETFSKNMLSTNTDLMSVGGALVGFAISVFGLRWYGGKSVNNAGFQPVLLRHSNTQYQQNNFSVG